MQRGEDCERGVVRETSVDGLAEGAADSGAGTWETRVEFADCLRNEFVSGGEVIVVFKAEFGETLGEGAE